MAIVEFKDVTRIYTSGDHELKALDGVNFTLDEGKFVVILGPSGAGKSTLLNIERIEVHNNDKSSGHCYVKVDIYFTAVGMIDIPTEQEILAMMEEIRANPQEFRFVA